MSNVRQVLDVYVILITDVCSEGSNNEITLPELKDVLKNLLGEDYEIFDPQ